MNQKNIGTLKENLEHSFGRQEGERQGFIVANPKAKQFDDAGNFVELPFVNTIREQVKSWKQAGRPGLTGITQKLLEHWEDRNQRQFPFFFCQLEAIETLIFLVEAPSAYRTGINLKEMGDGGPIERVCSKMATGSGKTVIMSMIIAWNVLNKSTYKRDTRYSKNILVVAPGLTVKTRLSVLQPFDSGNYYDFFNIVPPSLREKLRQGSIKISNWHKLSWETDEKIKSKKGVDKRGALSDTAYVKSVLGSQFAKAKNILVLNDEAHHAWRTAAESKKKKVRAEDIDNTIWIGGLDRISKKIGILRCHDLSATPFSPTGKKNNEQGLFQWIVSDFGLNDAIESGLVKTPRVVVRDDGKRGSDYRSRLYHIYMDRDVKPDLNQKQDNIPLPDLVKNAYDLLALDWQETKKEWVQEGIKIPPVMITVANNTYTATRVYNHFLQNDCEIKELGNKEKLLQIDSKTLGALDNEKTNLSKSKKELVEQLRAKINSVGKKGEPGEQVQNVISVAMLSEGWDARNVTQIMGLRAFTSQLLCEQVVGRGLRRVSYDFNEEDMLEPEYVNIFGVPFSFLPHEGGTSKPRPARPITLIEPVEDKIEYKISFPNVLRVDTILHNHLTLNYDAIKPLEIDPADNITEAQLAGVIDFNANSAVAISDIDLKQLSEQYRLQTIIFKVASKIFQADKSGWEGDHFAFISQLIKITEQFIHSDKIIIKSDLFNNDPLRRRILLMLNMTRIVQHFRMELKNQNIKELTPVFDKERPIRSTADMSTWYTTKPNDSHHKCHVNFTVFDSTWEANNADILDKHPKVKSFVKNDHLGFTIKYNFRGVVKNYYPDYIVELKNGDKLILEVKGQDSDENRIKRDFLNLWVKAINAHGGFGTWHWAVVFNSSEIHDILENYVDFPDRAYLPVKEDAPKEEIEEITEEVSAFYDISKEDLLKQGDVSKMIELVVKHLLSKNIESIQQLIAKTVTDDKVISLEDVQQVIYNKLDGTTPQNPDKFKARVRSSFKGAKHLHKQSFDYLVSAEFLFDQLKVFPDGDYAPFILQYARAVENELIQKIFIPFTNEALDQPGKLTDTYQDDLNDRKVGFFADMICHGRKTYTLGSMLKILSLPDNFNTLQDSLLVQDLNDFLITKDLKFAKSKVFREKLYELTSKYRNKSAHTNKMNKEAAIGCKVLVGQILVRWLEDIN